MPVWVSESELRQWPVEAIGALQAHRLLVRARPARTVVCPGCEADCVMPVQTIPAGPRAAARFIVCDKRSDINRVALTTAHVDQWKCDAEALARFVVEQLGLRRSQHRVDASGTRPLGLAAGDTRHQMLGLRTHGDVTLVVADTAVALADLIDFDQAPTCWTPPPCATSLMRRRPPTRATRRVRRGARPARSTRRRGTGAGKRPTAR